MYLLATFILQNSKKILRADPELWGCAIFGSKMAHLYWTNFFGTNHYYYFHLPISASHCAKSLKILPADPELLGCSIFRPKMAHFPKWEFFRKTFDEPCFLHPCLSICQKSKSDINLLVKYWRLKNTEISLAESHFWITWELDFSQACSFRRMLMNHKNFHLTQIPDKTNGVIFLKIPKNMFWSILTIFGHFCLMGILPKNLALSHTTIYGPLTSC